jgi:poly(beta-D-mannuronate) C5 epimerase
VVDSSFAVPAGALFVSSSGVDSASGLSVGSALGSLGRAVAVARDGQTIVVRGGTYRESLGSLSKRVTIQAFPHEQVWLKGSVVVSGWSGSGGGWVHSGWNPNICRRCYSAAALDRRYPAAGWADQVFVNGVAQIQVLSRSQLGAGRFFVDVGRRELWLGSSPAGRVVEATVLDKALQFSSRAAGSVVRGIGFAHYAAHYNMDVPSEVIVNAANVTLDRDTFAWSAGRGLSVFAPGAVVTNNLITNNGINGFHANRADGLVFSGNRVVASNGEHWSIEPTSSASIAGAKITATANAVFRNNVFVDNAANGLWLDVSCYNSVIANNVVLRSAGHGIAVEVSGKTIVAGNVSAGNARIGLKISGANDVEAWNNTLVNNGWAQLAVYEDPRHNVHPVNGVTWDTARVRVMNTILAGIGSESKPMLESFDANHPRRTTTQAMISADDYNLWIRPSRSAPKTLASWQITPAKSFGVTGIAILQAYLGRERSSVSIDNLSLASAWAYPAGYSSQLRGSSATPPRGASLPAAVAAAMGAAAGSPAHIGSLLAPTS